jgi:predicted PP-loop superfamily ATPase
VKAAAVAARRVLVLHAAAHHLHDVAAHRGVGVEMDAVRAATKAVVNFAATANSAATLRVLKVVATTVHAQKAALTTEATTARHVKTRRAVTAPHFAMAMSCPVTSTL